MNVASLDSKTLYSVDDNTNNNNISTKKRSSVKSSFSNFFASFDAVFNSSRLKAGFTNKKFTDIEKRAVSIISNTSINASIFLNTNPPIVENAYTLPEASLEGIKVGLPNIDDKGGFGNTCWLNSILKFVSSGTEFDSMLTQKIPPEAINAQTQFRNIVSTLRTGITPDGQFVKSIPEKMYKKFLRSLKELRKPDKNEPIIPRYQGVGSQQDASEFLQAFGKAFEWQPFIDSNAVQNSVNEQRNFPRQATIFTPTGYTPKEINKPPKHDPSMAFVTINLPSHLLDLPQKRINITKLTEEREIREARHRADNPHSGNFNWEVRKRFTCLPATMILSLNRAILSENFQLNENLMQRKVDNLVRINKDGFISLTEYKPIYENENIIGFVPQKICHYRIESALTHLGQEANSGHYICEERTGSGLMLEHSDMQVREIDNEAQFGVRGSLLRLKLIKEEPVGKDELKNYKEKSLKGYIKLFQRERSIESIPFDMQVALLQRYETLIKLQKASNRHTGEIFPSYQGERLLQSYQNYANLLKGCMASIEQG